MSEEANAPASGLFAIDNTSIAMFKDCPRKYYYGIILGRRPNKASSPLSWGLAYHDGLETFDRALGRGLSRRDALHAAIRKVWSADLPEGDPARTRTTLIRALVWHEAHYRTDFLETFILPDGKPAVELSFRVELPFRFSSADAPVIYCGHMDKLATYQGRLYAVEHKHTKSGLSDYYWDRYVFSSQISGYVLAAEANFNVEIGGAVIDATQIGVGFARFGRRVANRVKAHQEEWLLDLSYYLTQLDACFAADRWPHNTESCNKYGGCQFRTVCFANPGVREVILRDEFRHEPWNPLRPRGEEENS